jgi:hypothetical protein
MGRPAWVHEDQEKWLTDQVTEYLKVKGSKKEVSKFWPAFFEGWKEQWPTPALTDPVRDGDSSVSTPRLATVDSEVLADKDTVTEQPSAAPKKAKKAKKPLTVQMVRTGTSLFKLLLMRL